MSSTLDTLNTVLNNVTANRAQVQAALTSAQAQAGTLTPDVQAAIDLLLKTFGNPQGAGQIMNSVWQVENLQKTGAEMDALIAGLQVVISDEQLLEATEAQAAANVQAAASPLPAAAPGSAPVAAGPAASAPVAAPSA